jgi:hypothetical protein
MNHRDAARNCGLAICASKFESELGRSQDSNSDVLAPIRRAPRLLNVASGNDQSSLEEKIILLGRQDGLRWCR